MTNRRTGIGKISVFPEYSRRSTYSKAWPRRP